MDELLAHELHQRFEEQHKNWLKRQNARRAIRTDLAEARRHGLNARHTAKLARDKPMDHKTLAAALAAFQANLPHLAKNNEAKVITQKGNFSYRYADLATLSALVLPKLAAQGLAWTTMPKLVDGRLVLAYQLIHATERLTGEYPIEGRTPQEIGSALTYARRYCLCAVTGVAAQEDDDDAAAAQKGTRAMKQRNQPAQYDRPDRTVGTAGPLTPQMRRMMALLGEAGHHSRDDALNYCSAVTGRTITSRSDLTTNEVDLIIDTLEQAAQEPHQP